MVSAADVAALRAHTDVIEADLVVPLEQEIARQRKAEKKARKQLRHRRKVPHRVLLRVVGELEKELADARNARAQLADEADILIIQMMSASEELKEKDDEHLGDLLALHALEADMRALEEEVHAEKREVEELQQAARVFAA
mmetsp:Transcript_8322/g.21481  ORF Transcript_8322/g.21481 Transcript_8322/m.21481 type:complete len:141 (+) Transcript_8322:1-423(+)